MFQAAGYLNTPDLDGHQRDFVLIGLTEEDWAHLRQKQPTVIKLDSMLPGAHTDIYVFAGTNSEDLIAQIQNIRTRALPFDHLPGDTPDTLTDADLLTAMRVVDVLTTTVLDDPNTGLPLSTYYRETGDRLARMLRLRGIPIGAAGIEAEEPEG